MKQIMPRQFLLTLAMALTGALSALAAAPTLKLGDAAPPLQVGKWVQGDAVTKFDQDKAYLVEFWATWCGPCRASIPHLNEIHLKYQDKGLVVIGQNVWEQNEEQVKPFIEKMGEKMTYRVAMDDKTTKESGAMAETWMVAAGQQGIPAAFLVGKDGKIAWIGHPMTLKETVIEAVLAGKYDLAKAAEEAKKQQESQGELRKLSQQLGKQIQAKEWADAEGTLNAIAKLLPADSGDAVEGTRFLIVTGKGDLDASLELAERISAKSKDNAMALNQVAWQLVAQKDVKERAIAAAYKIATRANEVAKGKDGAILDTLARVTYLKGEKKKAIELQQKAVDLTDDETLKKQLEKSLKSYKAGKLPEVE